MTIPSYTTIKKGYIVYGSAISDLRKEWNKEGKMPGKSVKSRSKLLVLFPVRLFQNRAI